MSILKEMPQVGQRYLYEGPDNTEQYCKIIYEIVGTSNPLGEHKTRMVGIQKLQVLAGDSPWCYEDYEEYSIDELQNEVFSYLLGQDKPIC